MCKDARTVPFIRPEKKTRERTQEAMRREEQKLSAEEAVGAGELQKSSTLAVPEPPR